VVAIIATGDELVLPGEIPAADQIVASNNIGLAHTVEAAGGQPLDLGVAADTRAALINKVEQAIDAGADILVTSGGASVGDHDLVKATLEELGMQVGFWTIAMRPGKPLMFGTLKHMKMLGFPGNPVSALVSSHVFLKPLIQAYLGMDSALDVLPGISGREIDPNDHREEFMRAVAQKDATGRVVVTPFVRQDSSMLRIFAEANALLIRPANSPKIDAGAAIRYLPLRAPLEPQTG
jgi:molybdopterin molybdotransferase